MWFLFIADFIAASIGWFVALEILKLSICCVCCAGAGCAGAGWEFIGVVFAGFAFVGTGFAGIGFGVGLDELKKRKISPNELLDDLKEHPTIAKIIKNGKTVEYSAHLIPEGGLNSMPKVYDNRVMVVGDAAMMVNNVHMEGTNFAMLSGKLAAETAIFAVEKGDFSASTLSLYYKKLKNSVIIKDMSTHKNTIPVLKKHISTLTNYYPELLCEFFALLTDVDQIPKRAKYRGFLSRLIRKGFILKSIPLGLFALEKCFRKWI